MSSKSICTLFEAHLLKLFSIEYFYSHIQINSRFYQSIFTLGNLSFTNLAKVQNVFHDGIMSIILEKISETLKLLNTCDLYCGVFLLETIKETSLLSVMAVGKGYLSFNALGLLLLF